MKNLIYFVFFTILISSKSYSQLPQDYPFKTLLDDQNNLLVTGYDESNDVFVTKYPPNDPNFIWTKSYLNPGKDRGMDLVADSQYVYTTGYINNSALNCNDIFLIKYNGDDGETLWTRKITSDRDSKAFGIALDNDKNVYIAGYVTNKNNHKSDIITMKYNPAGILLWSKIYNNAQYNSDDVGTHILVDNYYVYVSGYTYMGMQNKNDIVLLTYIQENGNLSVPAQTFYDKRNQIPTSFLITELSDNISAKSRMAIGCISDNPVNNNQTDFLTLYFVSDTLKWIKKFNGAGNGEDVPTAITKDGVGNLYVTGYSFNGINNNLDYASIKYSKFDGQELWNPGVAYFDNQGGNDKASSIKVGDNNKVYIAGESEKAETGYIIKAYRQDNNILTNDWSDEFNPVFDIIKEDHTIPLKKGSRVDIDNLGNIFLTVFTWNNNGASYAVRKYDQYGQILFTIDNSGNRPGKILKTDEKPKQVNIKKQSFETKD